MSKQVPESIARSLFAGQDRNGGSLPSEFIAPTYTATINAYPHIDADQHNAMAAGFFGAFPDMHQIVEETMTEGNRVAMRFRMQGTNTGDFMDAPATGKVIDVPGIAILTCEEGRVVSLTEVFDMHSMLQQLGMAPE